MTQEAPFLKLRRDAKDPTTMLGGFFELVMALLKVGFWLAVVVAALFFIGWAMPALENFAILGLGALLLLSKKIMALISNPSAWLWFVGFGLIVVLFDRLRRIEDKLDTLLDEQESKYRGYD